MRAAEQVQNSEFRRVVIAPGPPPIYIEVLVAPWSKRDRAAWAWPSKLTPAAWAETYRYLVKTALPGRWRNDNAPYLRGMMNIGGGMAKGVIRLTIKKAAQIGASEALRTLMGYWAQQDPEPMGLALPNKEKGREIVENEILPFFKREFGRSEELRGLLSERLHDMKKGQIKLANTFLLYLMWSGSPASMASNPMKRAVCDEVDKFAPWAGNDADPVSLIEKRMRTYPDAMLILNSTPTGPEGMISQSFEQSHVRLYYMVSCPHCGVRQRLVFGEGGDYGIKWTSEVRQLRKEGRHEAAAALALQPDQVWYECCACHGKIDERQKRAMVREGKWGTVGGDELRGDAGEMQNAECGMRNAWDGGPIGDAESITRWPAGTWVGMQISSLYCCWESWTMAQVAAEFLQARTLPQKFAFRTSTLGETWQQAVERIDIDVLDARVAEAAAAGAAGGEEGVVPRWAARLIATVDTQQDHFWLVIRAWGPGLRSQRVWHGRVESFAEIEQWCWRTPWKNEDSRLSPRICDKILIDTGGTRRWDLAEYAEGPLPSRVMEVYAWVLRHGDVAAIKGDARPNPGQYIRRARGEFVTDREKRAVVLWLLDVHHFQDQLADLMRTRVDDVDWATGEVRSAVQEGMKSGGLPLWALNRRNDGEYNRHLAAMHKVTEGKGASMVQVWRPKREGMRVDYRACEGYQVAGAFMTGVHLLPDMGTWLEAQAAELGRKGQGTEARRHQGTEGVRTADGRAFVVSQRIRVTMND